MGVGRAFSNVSLHIFDSPRWHRLQPDLWRAYSKQRQGVDREVKNLDESKRADQRNRNRDRRDNRGAPILQEKKITMITMTMASARVFNTSRIESPTTVVVSKAMA